MEFDKSRVYTALNAEELKIGSKCIFADTICSLREQVQRKNYEDSIFLLRSIRGDDSTYRFDDGERRFSFVYLIEPPAELEYTPFSSNKKAMEAIMKHGGWVYHKKAGFFFFIAGIDIDGEDGPIIQMGTDWYGADELFRKYVFADDCSPCGELVEQ